MSEIIRPGTRILITPGTATSANFSLSKSEILNVVTRAAEIGIEIVQIREKSLSARLLLELAAEAVELVSDSLTRIFVNERFDIAITAKAHGVQLTSSSVPVDRVRQLLPVEMIVGVSAHSADEVTEANANGADFAMLGPVFATPGKGDAMGLQNLAEICSAASPFPIVGVGGIDGTNESQILQSGAAGFAAIRYLNDFVKIEQ